MDDDSVPCRAKTNHRNDSPLCDYYFHSCFAKLWPCKSNALETRRMSCLSHPIGTAPMTIDICNNNISFTSNAQAV